MDLEENRTTQQIVMYRKFNIIYLGGSGRWSYYEQGAAYEIASSSDTRLVHCMLSKSTISVLFYWIFTLDIIVAPVAS